MEVFIDGACEPINPGGTGSIGIVVKYQGKLLKGKKVIGAGPQISNNVAEYSALLSFLEWYVNNKHLEKVAIKSDSKLVVNQMSGLWRVNDGLYFPVYQRCKNLMDLYQLKNRISFEWIPREQNAEADRLSKEALELAGVTRCQ